MKNLFMIFSVLVIAGACGTKPDSKEIINVDRAFSARSEQLGFKKAFIEFAHDSVVMLRDKKRPILGINELTEHFQMQNDSGIIFRWFPVKGEVSGSNDLAYTYGTYEIITDRDTSKGTYVSIWKKDKNGNWKYILDSGNEGGVE